jgi:N-acetylglucosaminyl-diphospho-decaprenol L-rhamnosyltransferase
MARVSLSTIVVAHDSLAELRRSLPPLVTQLAEGDELIVVDNASSDGLAGELGRLAPGARLIELPRNVGFAAGANRGVQEAGGELVVLLNPDCLVQPGWVEAIRAPWGGEWTAWMGLVLLEGGEQINSSGGVLHFTGFGWAGQVGAPAEAAPPTPAEVGFLSGACLAIPRSVWREAGGFPEHFFMYCEDVDLSLKLRVRGGTLAVVPDARVEHSYEFAKGELKWRLLERNRWATVLRTYPAPLLAVVLPALLATETAVWAVALRAGWGRSKALATLDVVRALPRLFRERRVIQAGRKVSAGSFAVHLTAELSSPYFGDVGTDPLVRAVLRIYWRAVLGLLR